MSHSITFYFGTMTGNSETLAQRAAERAEKSGWTVTLRNLSDVKSTELGSSPVACFFVSTWGDGEPPADACDFFYDLMKRKDLDFARLRYAVFGLGDSDYPDFNAFARNLDERLAVLGAQAFLERAEADLDYVDTYEEWEGRVFAELDRLKESFEPVSS